LSTNILSFLFFPFKIFYCTQTHTWFLVTDWLYSVGQNYFYVMMLLYRDAVLFGVYTSVLSFKEDSVQNSKQLVQFATVWTTCYTVRTLNCPSIICSDDENFSSGPSFVSRSFELLQLAFVRMSQQHV
jgi:hypothetical protein